MIISLKKKMRVPLAEIAREMTKLDKGEYQSNIAQASELLSHAVNLLAKEYRKNPRGVVKLLKDRYNAA